MRSEEQLKSAIRKLQSFGGIPETGVIDEKTRMLLKAPRCGVADYDSRNSLNRVQNRRFKRFVVHDGMKWSHHNLTWRYILYYLNELVNAFKKQLSNADIFYQ